MKSFPRATNDIGGLYRRTTEIFAIHETALCHVLAKQFPEYAAVINALVSKTIQGAKASYMRRLF